MSSATEIKASDVQKLRQLTGAGLMDCKKALTEANGDLDKANKILREKGILKSSKRADRVAGEGLIEAWVSADKKKGILLELNCETDFVARNDEFLALAKTILQQIQANPAWTSVEQIPQEPILALSGKIGEKLQVRRFAHFKSANGLIESYIHHGSKHGTLLDIESKKEGAPTAGLLELAHELALQITAAKPSYISRENVPAAILESEKEIAKKQLEGQNKPPEILEKIATGKLQQYFSAHCLLDMVYQKDEAGKKLIKDLLKEAGQKDGNEFTVKQFVGFHVGAE